MLRAGSGNNCHSPPLTYSLCFILTWDLSKVDQVTPLSGLYSFTFIYMFLSCPREAAEALFSNLQGSLAEWMSHCWSQRCRVEGHPLSLAVYSATIQIDDLRKPLFPHSPVAATEYVGKNLCIFAFRNIGNTCVPVIQINTPQCLFQQLCGVQL